MKPTHVSKEKAKAVDESLLPSKEWQQQQVGTFSDVRIRFERHHSLYQNGKVPEELNTHYKLPSKTNERGWAAFCFGQAFWEKIVQSRGEDTKESDRKRSKAFDDIEVGQHPNTSLLCQLKVSEAVNLLEYQVEWAEELGEITFAQGLWCYSLFIRLEKPLYPDTSSVLRSLAHVCIKQRSALTKPSEILVHLNLMICLVARYFDQLDLAD